MLPASSHHGSPPRKCQFPPCPGAAMLCKLVREPACGRQCLTSAQQSTILSAVEAICANPC